MGEKRELIFDDIKYTIYDSSIHVEGVESSIYYGREVTEEDAFHLSRIVNLGKWHKVKEIKKAIDNGIYITYHRSIL